MINAEKIKQKTEIQGVSARLVFKEYVHLVILEYLFRKGFFLIWYFKAVPLLDLSIRE